MKELIGTGVALVTPFRRDGSVDFDGLEKLVHYNVNSGVDYIVILGTTAESATLSKNEKVKIIETIKKANNKRVPLVLGIGGNNTSEIIKEYKETDLTDYIGVLTVSPYYNRPNQEGIYQHYKAISESTDSNIILYNVPSRTGSNIEPETTIRLANDFKNIIAIKEASPNFLQSTDIIRLNTRNDFHIISGDDELAVPMILAGGSGIITVIGQGIPKEFTHMINSAIKKNVKEAYENHYQIVKLIRAIFEEGNPAGIKVILENRKICTSKTRLPLVEATDKLKIKIDQLLTNLKN